MWMYTCSRICKFTQMHPHTFTYWHTHNSIHTHTHTHTHTHMLHLWLALVPYYISPHSGGLSIFILIFLVTSGVPRLYLNLKLQMSIPLWQLWLGFTVGNIQAELTLCVLFRFRHCEAFTGEGEIATTATGWHTQAEGNGLCSSLILKITFWKGGRRHNYLLQPTGFMLTERRDLHVLAKVKLHKKKQ